MLAISKKIVERRMLMFVCRRFLVLGKTIFLNDID